MGKKLSGLFWRVQHLDGTGPYRSDDARIRDAINHETKLNDDPRKPTPPDDPALGRPGLTLSDVAAEKGLGSNGAFFGFRSLAQLCTWFDRPDTAVLLRYMPDLRVTAFRRKALGFVADGKAQTVAWPKPELNSLRAMLGLSLAVPPPVLDAPLASVYDYPTADAATAALEASAHVR